MAALGGRAVGGSGCGARSFGGNCIGGNGLVVVVVSCGCGVAGRG